jgi:hypothetical protein
MGGTRGGLVAFDLRARRTDAHWLPGLRTSSIYEIEEVDGRLWLATDQGVGIRGDDGAWEWLRTDGGLPANRVLAIEPMGDTVWLATSAGPGGLANGAWFGRRWVPALDADSVVMELTADPPNWSEQDAILRLAWLLRLDRWGAGFVAAMRGMPRESLDRWRAGELGFDAFMSEPVVYPYLVEAYLRRSGGHSVGNRAIASFVPRSEELARDLLRRADVSQGERARYAAYAHLGDHPQLMLEDARRVLRRDSISRQDEGVTLRALGRYGDVSDLEFLYDRSPRNQGSTDPGALEEAHFSAIAEIITRSSPQAVQEVLRDKSVSDRVFTLRRLGSREPLRAIVEVQCLVGLEGLTDTSLGINDRADFARILEPLGVHEALPVAMEQSWWDPAPWIQRLRGQPLLIRGFTLQSTDPGVDAREWMRAWWDQIGRHRPRTNCAGLGSA